MRKKQIIIFGITVALIIITIACMVYFVPRNTSNKSYKVTEDKFNITIFNLENREKLFVQTELLIGNNIKELENGYYDFKLLEKGELLTITLNKLWYEEYGTDYIQDEYLAKICREVVKCIKISEKSDLEYQLYKYIKDNYLLVKQGSTGEVIKLNQVSIWSEPHLSQCVVYIKVE